MIQVDSHHFHISIGTIDGAPSIPMKKSNNLSQIKIQECNVHSVHIRLNESKFTLDCGTLKSCETSIQLSDASFQTLWITNVREAKYCLHLLSILYEQLTSTRLITTLCTKIGSYIVSLQEATKQRKKHSGLEFTPLERATLLAEKDVCKGQQ